MIIYFATSCRKVNMNDIKLKEAERLGDFLENGNNNQALEYNDVIGIL